MRVLVFSHREAVKKLVEQLTEQHNDVTVIPSVSGNITRVKNKEIFDIGIVDDLCQGAVIACHHIKKILDIPLVLMVSKRHSDWKRVWMLNADGYIPSDVGDQEFRARLNALLRRLSDLNKPEYRQEKPIAGKAKPVNTFAGLRTDNRTGFNTREVARILNIHVNTVRRWSNLGILPTYHNRGRGEKLFKPEDVDTFLGLYSQTGKTK